MFKILSLIVVFFSIYFSLFAQDSLTITNHGDTLSYDTVAPKKSSAKVLTGVASFYSDYFEGRKTANGEIFSQRKLTCACNVLPLGTYIRVTSIKNGKSIVVKVNDRLHPRMKRIVDLTRLGAEKLNFVNAGLTKVKVEVIGKKAPK